ncbi:MAG: type II TA system antitoxin MqsA family protein [Bryobacteraceae bacterium]
MEQVCSVCGSPTHTTRGSYHYEESGLDNLTLKNVELLHCDNCGNEDPVIEAIETLHEGIAQAIAKRPGRLQGQEIRFLRKHLELTARQIAEILQVDHTTVSKWENDKDPIGSQSERLLRAILMTMPKRRNSLLQQLARQTETDARSNIEIDDKLAVQYA